MPERDEGLVTTAEAMNMLGVARSTLYQMMKRGDLTPIKPRRAVRKQPLYFRRDEIERLLAQGPADAEP